MFSFFTIFHNGARVDFPVGELIPKFTSPLYECLKILNKRPVDLDKHARTILGI